MNDNNILAVVLAGGQSKRFGEDKNQVKLGKITLLDHVLAKVTNKFEKILIISNQNLNIKALTSITIIPDCIQGNLGPLVGVLTAMKWIKKNNKQYQWIATFPCDTPFFDTSIIEKYKNKINLNKSLLYFVKSNQKRHNIFGLWSVKLMDTLENDLVNNNFRKVEEWADKIGVEIINIKIDKFDPFFNINTKVDLKEAEKILKEYKND
jgi:molybdopterin-guanine dinucleotide biosynthesis protein A